MITLFPSSRSQPRDAKSASALFTVSRDAPTSCASSSWVRSCVTRSTPPSRVPNLPAICSRFLASDSAASASTPWNIPLRASTSSISSTSARASPRHASLCTSNAGQGAHPGKIDGTMESVSGVLTWRHEDGLDLPVLVWRLDPPELVISSGALGGGIGARRWVVNATVPMSYHPPDVPAQLTELASGLGLTGPGTALITGLDVARVVTGTDGGGAAAATVGLGDPGWAAAPPAPAQRVGTINLVVRVPVRLSEAALVNAVATAAEAKCQALGEMAIPGTGTCTDATVIHCPMSGSPQRYGGPRSTWGAPLPRAVHAAGLGGGPGRV